MAGTKQENMSKKLPTPEQPDIHYGKANILDGLPPFLKEPKNYMVVQKALLETMTCGKSHSDPAEMLKCKKCAENMLKRRQLMAKFGFKSPAQYMSWKETHEEIKKRVPLDMYNRMVEDKV